MKFTTIAISAAFIGLSVAQGSVQGLPTCAQSCASDSIPKSCGVDVKCICSAQEFINGVTCCVRSACNADDQQKTLTYAQQLCSGAGVTGLSLDGASCGASSSASGAVSSASSATSSAGAAASSTASSASAAISSASSAAASPASTGNVAAQDIVAHGLTVAGLAVAGAFALV